MRAASVRLFPREDGQRQRRLDVKVALRQIRQRAVQNRFRTLLERRDKREPILAEFRQLQHALDVDAVARIGRAHLGEDAGAIVDREAHVVRSDHIARHGMEDRVGRRRGDLSG